ncbi:MAG: hypothetical protein F4Y58_01390, partial [Gammaproteobacteria bacterium]|nr:hypothetical protein [Gammaproteobacteria bacterium]
MMYRITYISLIATFGVALSQPAFAQQPVAETDAFECDYVNDIDQDDDGLIEICHLEALSAIRYQLDGSGYKASAGVGKITAGCDEDGSGECIGYELARDLDFNDDTSYRSDVTVNASTTRMNNVKIAWTNGDGWQPIGSIANDNCDDAASECFTAIFEGNGYTISSLYIVRVVANQGLFGALGAGEIRNIGFLKIEVGNSSRNGAIVGFNHQGLVQNSYVVDG